MILKKKRVGTILPITALVSKTAKSGSFAAGEKFIDWLTKSKQTAWQILPLHQTQLEKKSATKHVPSPYKSYGIGLNPRFLGDNPPPLSTQQQTKFIKNNSYWLEDYALFCALRDHLGTDSWSLWPIEIRKRDPDTLKNWREKLARKIGTHIKTQVQLHFAYQKLKQNATNKKILLIGDLPFYLGLNSPLVWQHQHLFDLDETSKLQKSSGVLVGKSHFGRQVWGHPLYKWQKNDLLPELEKLFQIRLKYLANLFDWIRFDHANGLFLYGAMDLSDARSDRSLEGPGSDFLDKLIKFAEQQKMNIYAEDIGIKLKKLRAYMSSHQIPGIRLFRFAYDERRKKFLNRYLKIDQYPNNTFAYTTTHDTETLVGYLEKLSSSELDTLAIKLGIGNTKDVNYLSKLIRNKLIHSPAKIVLIPLQDWLLTTDRINIPGSEKEIDDPNWRYQMSVPIEDLPTKLY